MGGTGFGYLMLPSLRDVRIADEGGVWWGVLDLPGVGFGFFVQSRPGGASDSAVSGRSAWGLFWCFFLAGVWGARSLFCVPLHPNYGLGRYVQCLLVSKVQVVRPST